MPRLLAATIAIVFLATASPLRAQICLESNPILSGFYDVRFVDTGDFDGDLRPDIVVGRLGYFALVRNRSDGTFAPGVVGAQTSGLKYFCTGDFDSDGIADLLSSTGGTVVLHRGLGNGSLAAPVATGATSSLFCAKAADLNGDGRDDALLAALTSALVIQLQAPTGGLLPPVTYPNVGGVVVPEDFDGDGDIDIALVAGDLVQMMMNAGDGTLTALSPFPLTPMVLRDAAGGDLDGDGDADLVIVTAPAQISSVSQVQILWNLGPPNFQASILLGVPDSSRPIAALVADMDSDGVNDVVVTCESTANVSISRGLGGGSFAPPTVQSVGGWPKYAAVDDFDGDAILDLVTVDDYGRTSTILFGNGDATFRNRRKVPLTDLTTGSPMTIVSADLNGDAYPDLATTFHTSNYLTVHFNQGDGSFGPRIEITVGWNPYGLVAADLDGDGDTDLANSNWTRGISVLLNTGGGVFAPPIFYPAGEVQRGLVTADLDADGDLDLVVVAQNSSAIYFLPNNGNGTFATGVPIVVAANPLSIAAGDLDADGDVDLAVGHSLGKLRILRNAGNGSFPSASQMTYGGAIASVTMSDLDNDALPEIVTASAEHSLYIVRNLGGGSFAAATTVPAGLGSQEVRCVDLDDDGLADLAAASNLTFGLSVSKNLGGMAFGPKQEFSAGHQGRSIAVADFDLDGRKDLAVAARYDTSASLLLRCPAPSLAYCFGDGTGNACPCGVSDAGRGCPNGTFSSGARLSTSGIARVTADSLHLIAEWAPDGIGVFLRGTQASSVPFGEGVLCVGGGIVRLAVVAVVGNRAVLPNHAQSSPVHALSGATPGTTEYFQFAYRDNHPGFCTSATFNSTNGVVTNWGQ